MYNLQMRSTILIDGRTRIDWVKIDNKTVSKFNGEYTELSPLKDHLNEEILSIVKDEINQNTRMEVLIIKDAKPKLYNGRKGYEIKFSTYKHLN